MSDPAEIEFVQGNQNNATRRGGHEPAPTLFFGHRMNEVRWETRNGGWGEDFGRDADEPAPTLSAQGLAKGRDVLVMAKKEDRPERKAQGAGNTPRREDEPAATLDTRTDLAKWTEERPSPTVCGDARGLPEPKYRKGNERQWNENAVRVTQEQAAALQTFPPDYPWQGSRTKQFEQIGNAVPPLLAEHILRALLPLDEERKAA